MFLFYNWPFWHARALRENFNLGSVFSDNVVFYGDFKICVKLS